MCRLTERLASRHEPFVVGNIMKGRFTPGTRTSLPEQGI